jgi:hypothetical protein
LLAPLHGAITVKAFGAVRSRAVMARLTLPDGATIATAPGARAQLRFPDTAVLDIGSDTVLSIGPFNRFLSGRVNRLALMRGAVRLTAMLPQGFANYIVVTPTAQTAIRSQRTIVTFAISRAGLLVSCALCRSVISVPVGGTPVTLISGQTLSVTSGPDAPIVSTVPSRNVHDRGIDQFSAGGYPAAR